MSKQFSVLVMCSCVLMAVGLMSIGVRAGDQSVAQSLSEPVNHRLVAARVHIDNEAFAQAHQVLDDLKNDSTLNPAEQAQVLDVRGYAYYASDDLKQAIAQYAELVDHSTGASQGLVQSTLYTLAQLHFVEENYPEALDYIQRWSAGAETIAPVAQVFMAQTLLRMDDAEAALTQMNQALEAASGRKTDTNPNWLKFRDYLASVVAGEDVEAPLHTGAYDGDYLAVAKFAPIYPAAARKAKIEGFVVVEFSVAADGSTADRRVVEASPAGIFDSAALAAVEKFRYKPRVVDGAPVSVSGIRNKIAFQLPDA